jgi:hypothetical protein
MKSSATRPFSAVPAPRLFLLVSILASFGMTACGGSGSGGGTTPPPTKTLTSIAVTATASSITVGATDQLTATGTYSDSSTADLTGSTTWASSSTATATISSAGLATAVAAGTTNITASSGGVTSQPFALTVTTTMRTTVAQWAQTVAADSAAAPSDFNAIAVDSSGNVYAAAILDHNGTVGLNLNYDFGNGVTLTGVTEDTQVLVEYNSSGAAQWVSSLGPDWLKGITSAPNWLAGITSVAVDQSGNIYAAGFTPGGGTYNFGNGVTLTLGAGSNRRMFLVQYNSSGVAQWAQANSSGSADVELSSVSVDSGGNIYVAGYISGSTAAYDFGNGVTAASVNSGTNILLVKYNSFGVAQWAQTVSAATDPSSISAISIDSSNNVYAVITLNRSVNAGVFNFGNQITVTNTYQYGDVLVKYSPSGAAQWASSVANATINSLCVDSSGNIYAGGYITASGIDFGNNVVAVSSGIYNANPNIVLVQYNSSGAAQWAQTVTTAPAMSGFNSVAVDSSGNISAAGYISYGTDCTGNCPEEYSFGNGVTATGYFVQYGSPITFVMGYNSSGVAQWAQTVTAVGGDIATSSQFNSVGVDSGGNIYAGGYISGSSGGFNFGNNVTATGTAGRNIILVQY